MKHRIFITIFAAACLIPSLGILIFGPAQAAANETLAAAPVVISADGSFNWEILSDITDWLGDHFALRQELVTAQHHLMAAVFHESGTDEVVLGKDGWLFYTETLDDYQGVNTMTQREAWAAGHSLALIQEYCTGKGIDFLFTVAPNKNSLYGAYMPSRYTLGTDRSLSRLTAELEQAGVRYLDLYGLLREQEEILYRKQDSHWNTRGAALAGDAILEALGREPEDFYSGSYTTVYEETGDLYEMVYPTGKQLDEDQRYDRAFTFSYVNPIRTAGDNMIYTTGEGKTGSLVMFRDSFGNALHPFLAESFSTACFSRLTPYNLSLLDAQNADTLVIELVERNLDWLSTLAAIYPAPERQVTAEKTADLTVSAAAASDGNLPGYVKITGSLAGYRLDTDSPVYLLAGNTVYEATPAGEGELPFTAYLPEAAAEEPIYLMIQQEGVLVQAAQPLSLLAS